MGFVQTKVTPIISYSKAIVLVVLLLPSSFLISCNSDSDKPVGEVEINHSTSNSDDMLHKSVNPNSMGISHQADVFQENKGYVVVEAEDTKMAGKWVSYNDNFKDWTSGYTGSGYIRFTGNTESSGPAEDILTYKIHIKNPGKYTLLIRALEAPIDSGEWDKANDCYVLMEGQSGFRGSFSKHVLIGDSYQWSWSVKAEPFIYIFRKPVYDLDIGIHEFKIAGRSKNFFIDRFVLYKDLDVDEAKSLSLMNASSESE